MWVTIASTGRSPASRGGPRRTRCRSGRFRAGRVRGSRRCCPGGEPRPAAAGRGGRPCRRAGRVPRRCADRRGPGGRDGDVELRGPGGVSGFVRADGCRCPRSRGDTQWGVEEVAHDDLCGAPVAQDGGDQAADRTGPGSQDPSAAHVSGPVHGVQGDRRRFGQNRAVQGEFRRQRTNLRGGHGQSERTG